MSILSKLFLMLCRFAVAALFLFAAYQKLFAPDSGPQKFALAVHSFKILPDHLVLLATGVIPWLEVICGILLICGLWTRAAATLLALLLIGFTAAVISVLARGLPVSCGCFGNLTLLCSKDVMTGCKVAENALILLPTLLVAVFGGGFLDSDRPMRRIRFDPPASQPTAPPPVASPSKA
ncbi:MAG: DoxX family membrane protein [Phycisphaeraceae bacterium]|nr:DoxX family membrane protein [Phycisphaeraceae bacterium]